MTCGAAVFGDDEYIVAKSNGQVDLAFANIDDGREHTVVMRKRDVDAKSRFVAFEAGYRVITFDMTLPLNTVGFIAEVSGALAAERIPVFVLSSYSTDHILVKGGDVPNAKKTLMRLGFDVR